MNTKTVARHLWNEIKEMVVNDLQAQVWPVMQKAILIMLPSIIFCAYSIINYDPMNINSIENYFMVRCAAIAFLLFSLCAIPAICFRKLQTVLAGIVAFVALGGYFCYLPYANYQNYSGVLLVHKIQFKEDNYGKVIQEGNYFLDICKNGKCSMATNYVQFYPTEGNKVKMKVTRNDSTSFFSNEISIKDIIITDNTMQVN